MLQHRLLMYLDQVARAGSIRKAAARLHISASAINRQILALEDELGTPLFQRLPRKMVLTAAGEVLIHHVRQTFKELEWAQVKIEELKGLRRGEVTVAMMSGLAANLIRFFRRLKGGGEEVGVRVFRRNFIERRAVFEAVADDQVVAVIGITPDHLLHLRLRHAFAAGDVESLRFQVLQTLISQLAPAAIGHGTR